MPCKTVRARSGPLVAEKHKFGGGEGFPSLRGADMGLIVQSEKFM